MKYRALLFFIFPALSSYGQNINDFYANLYTDSLKRGTYNYINIEGVTKDGRVLPLDTVQIEFSASTGTFYGNSLWIDSSCAVDSVTVTYTLKEKAPEHKTLVIFIKKDEDSEELPSEADVINRARKNRRD